MYTNKIAVLYSKTTFVTVNHCRQSSAFYHSYIQKQPLLLLISSRKADLLYSKGIQKQPLLLLIL